MTLLQNFTNQIVKYKAKRTKHVNMAVAHESRIQKSNIADTKILDMYGCPGMPTAMINTCGCERNSCLVLCSLCSSYSDS